FTVGLTILITALSALAVSIVGIPITEFAVVIVGLPLAVIAFLLRRPATNPWMAFVDFVRRLFDFSDYTKGEKGVVAALYVAVVASWTQSFTIALDTAGTFTLRFELLNKAVAVVTEGHLPVVVM